MRFKNRKRNRLKNYDYSQNGLYFVTICTKDRIEYFGRIEKGEIILNDFGEIALQYYLEIPEHFSNAFLDEFIVMPNHIHGIIEICNYDSVGNAGFHCSVGNADLRSLRYDRSKMLLSKIIHGFKSSVSREMNKNNKFFQWQKSFYDHIIRNEISLNKIREYIRINPEIWERDRNNGDNLWV